MTATDLIWKKTACNLCYANCGLEVQTEGQSITKVRGDRAHPRSRGYLCQKASAISHYQSHKQRLSSPLRRRVDGTFEEVTWDTALGEIAEKLLAIGADHGPRSLGFYGGGGQGNHSGGGYGINMMRALGATDFYSSLAQEKSGRFLVNGEMFGTQNCNQTILTEDADLMIVLGGSIWQAQCEPHARTHLRHASNDEARKIIVIDPVRTKDAEFADLHLQLKPGTDTYLLGAMLKLLMDRDGFDQQFIETHTVGWQDIRDDIKRIPASAWIAHCDVPYEKVEQAVDMIIEAEAMTMRSELGIEMGKNSTLNSYLGNLLFLLTGNFGRPGTHAIHSWLQPLFGNSKGATSLVTGMKEIAGLYPPNRFPAEILTEKEDRLRAVIVDSSNPANSTADTQMTEAAFRALELLVVVDVAMSETAMLADYVLPASSQFEKHEFTLFTFAFPTNYFHVRQPLFEPLEGTRTEPEIYADLADRLGLLPPDDVIEDLRQLAASDRLAFSKSFGALMQQDKRYAGTAPIILYLTLGKTLANGAASAVILWPACHRLAGREAKAVQKALGTKSEGPLLGEELFETILNSHSGTAFTIHEYEDIWRMLGHKDQKIRLALPELQAWLGRLDPADDQVDADFPFTVSLGQRRQYNVNQIIRSPKWRPKELDGTLRLHPDELTKLGASDGGWITVTTRRGKLTARAEADDSLRPGYATLPHGYGMLYPLENGEMVQIGPRINMLTASDDCDPITDTPYHKNVAASLSVATNEEAALGEDASNKVMSWVSAAE